MEAEDSDDHFSSEPGGTVFLHYTQEAPDQWLLIMRQSLER